MEQMFGTTVRMPRNAARITPTGAEEDYENYHPRLSCLFLRQYKYPRCKSPGTLRILKLPPANLKHEVINCELVKSQTVGSDDTQEYETWSWCWGVEKEHMKAFLRIHCVQYVFLSRISQSLASALRALRDQVSVRYLWVDALCVNQLDNQEKNEQVPLMAQIYGNASKFASG